MITIDGSREKAAGRCCGPRWRCRWSPDSRSGSRTFAPAGSKPGLLRQHLTAVQAATADRLRRVEGDELGSRVADVHARRRHAGRLHVCGRHGRQRDARAADGAAAAAARRGAESTLTLEGGTHNPWAPPFDFLARVFLPLVAGWDRACRGDARAAGLLSGRRRPLRRHDRAGGVGSRRWTLLERGEIVDAPRRRARGESAAAHRRSRSATALRAARTGTRGCGRRSRSSRGRRARERGADRDRTATHVTEICTGFGESGVRAEAVAEQARRRSAPLPGGGRAGRAVTSRISCSVHGAGGGGIVPHTGAVASRAHERRRHPAVFDVDASTRTTRAATLMQRRRRGVRGRSRDRMPKARDSAREEASR